MQIENPYRPGSGISPPYFAGRDREVTLFKKKLNSGMNADFIQNMAIVGGWGSGKTSLLLQFKEIAKAVNCPVLPVQLYSVTDTKDFVELFVNSASFVISPSQWGKFSRTVSSIGINVLGSGVQIERKSPYFEPQTAFQHSLKNIWNNSDAPLILVMIDDVQLIAKREQTLEILRNVFTWTTNESYKFMLVVSGTMDLFEKFQEAHSPLTRFFEPMILNPLSDDEVRAAVLKPLENTLVSFSEEVIEQIINLSGGNPFYVQLLASHGFDHARNNRVDPEAFKLAFISAINDISVRMFNKLFKSVSPTERKVLRIIYGSGPPLRWSEIIKKSTGIKRNTVKPAIRRLLKAGLIKQIEDKEQEKYYTLIDKLFKEYLKIRFGG